MCQNNSSFFLKILIWKRKGLGIGNDWSQLRSYSFTHDGNVANWTSQHFLHGQEVIDPQSKLKKWKGDEKHENFY